MRSTILGISGITIALLAGAVQAELEIQSVQYKPEKDALFVKGKASADTVYVVNAASSSLIDTVDVKRGQFRQDIPVGDGNVPCMVQIQSNAPATRTNWWGGGGDAGRGAGAGRRS